MVKMKLFSWVVSVSAFALLCAVSTSALAADKLVVSSAVFQEVSVVNAEGKNEIQRVPVSKALPGSELIYVITYKNIGDKPVEDVVINNPLAKELLYKDQSAEGKDAAVAVSVDGGAHFGNLALLQIPTPDGASRLAEASDVTHLQFKLSKSVLPQEEGTASFRVILK